MCRAVVATVVALIGFNLTFASDRKPCSLISIDFLDARIPYSTADVFNGLYELLGDPVNGRPSYRRFRPSSQATNPHVYLYYRESFGGRWIVGYELGPSEMKPTAVAIINGETSEFPQDAVAGSVNLRQAAGSNPDFTATTFPDGDQLVFPCIAGLCDDGSGGNETGRVLKAWQGKTYQSLPKNSNIDYETAAEWARSVCHRGVRGSLLVLDSREESDFIVGSFPLPILLGARRDAKDGAYKWQGPTYIWEREQVIPAATAGAGFSDWATGQPAADDAKECVAVLAKDGAPQWTTHACEGWPQGENLIAVIEFSPRKVLRAANVVYEVVSDKYEAYGAAFNRIAAASWAGVPGSMLSFTSFDQAAVFTERMNYLAIRKKTPWLGFVRTASKWSYASGPRVGLPLLVDGKPAPLPGLGPPYVDWKVNHPLPSTAANCAISTQGVRRRWASLPCSGPSGISVAMYDMQPRLFYGGSSYMVLPSGYTNYTEALSQAAASYYRGVQGTLLTIESADENKFLRQNVPQLDLAIFAWLGAAYSPGGPGKAPGFAYTAGPLSGTRITEGEVPAPDAFVNFAPFYPRSLEDPDATLVGLAWEPTSGQMQNLEATRNALVVVEHRHRTLLPFRGSYYEILDEEASYDEAVAAARSLSSHGMQGQLLFLQTPEEARFLEGHLAVVGDVWLATVRDDGNTWRWQAGPHSGTPHFPAPPSPPLPGRQTVYNEWATGEPSDAQRMRCAVSRRMATAPGGLPRREWRAQDCMTDAVVVVKYSRRVLVPAVDVVYELLPDDMTYFEATAEVQRRRYNGTKGHLLAIGSQAENKKVHEAFGGGLWLAAQDASSEGTWHWTTDAGDASHLVFWDGFCGGAVPGVYSNFDAGQASSNRDRSLCDATKAGFTPLDGNRTAQHHTDLPGGCCKLCQDDPACSTWEFLDRGSQCHMGPTLVDKRGDRTLFKALSSSYSAAKNVTVDEMFDECAADCCADSRCDQADAFVPTVAVVLGGTKCKAGRPCCVLSKYSNPTSTARRRPQATLFTGIGQRHLAVRVKQDKVQLAADDPNCFLYHGVTRVKRSSLSTLGGLGGVTFDATGGDCLQLQRSGKWADLSCLNRRRVVIEYPQNPSAGPTAAPPTPADPCVTDDDGAAPSTLHVTHGGDDGPGSLRRAITTANSQGGFARITFQAGAGIVRLQTGLPAISSRVIIDGTTHPAYTADGSGPAVIIHWQRASGSQTVHGFHFRGIGASRSLLRGLTVQRFPGHGALVADARHVRIEACLFRDNRLHGLRLSASLPQFTTVGGANDTARCVFIGNFKSGVSVASPRNRIINNFIGVDSAGTAAAQQANRQAGIVLGASATGTEVRGNLVSGNGHEGIRVDGSCGIVVASNAVGVDLAGTSAIANVLGGVAVRSDGCGAGNRNIIGGDDGQGNLISGNTGPGLLLQASGVTVSNNIVGVGADGSTAIPNDGAGIAAENTLEATIGPANVLSGNTGSGLQLTAEVGRVSAVRVLHNSIGVGSDASLQIGNLAHGIRVNGAVEAVVAGNIVAGNGGCGVDVITSESRVAMVQENSIFSNAGGNTYCSPSAEPDLPAATIIEVYDDRLVVEATTSTAGFGESADGAFSVEVFSSPGNVPCDHGVAVARVGALNGTVQPGDTTVLTLEFASVVATGSILTATVTDWTRRTSAFSGCDARMGSGACQLCECTGTAVDCAGRNLAEVPGNIPATTQVLLLGRNQLTEIPATAVQRLQALQTLSAPDNKISDLEFTLTAGLARLVTMDLSSNEVTKIPAGFGAALQRLEELKLRGNKIRSLGMRQLAGMAALRIVDLGNNGWDGIAGGSFAGSLSLQSVDLSGGVAGGSYPGDLFRDLRGLALVNWHRDACPAGFALSFKTGGVYNCLRCGDGTYKPASNGSLTSCVPCPAGTSDADEQPVTPCEGCGAGVYAPRGSAGACTLFQCAPGTTDHDQDPSTACMVCPEGTFTAAGTQTPSCAPCPDGTTDHDRDPSTTCAACTDGQQVPARGIGPCERLLLTVSWGIIGGDGHLPSGVFGVSYPKVPPRQLRQKVSPPGAKIVSYIVSGLPCGMQFDEATGVVHGTPNEQRGEPFEISIRATSDIGVSALVNSGQRIVLAVHDCDDRTTCNGGQCIDTQPFDGRYQCDCSGLETFGPTCRDTGGRPFGVSWALPSRALPVGTLGFPYTFVAPAGAGVTIVGRGTVTQYLATSLPCGITVANQTGSLGGVARDSGTFSVSLLAQSSFQETAQVNDQALALVVRDCDDQLSCNGGACVDDLPFDGSYSCDCAGTDREGSDCTQPSASAAAAAQAATTGAVGGAIGAVLLTLLVLILLWRRRERQRQNQPFDFGQALQRLKESGFIQEEHLLDGAVHPREIKRGSITILETLGAGAFGDVCKGYLDESRSSGRPAYLIAIKTLKDESAEAKKDLLEEAALMASFDHPNVMTLIGVCTRGTPVLLCLPLCGLGALQGFLKKMATVLNLDAKLGVCHDIVEGCSYLARRNFVHRDLAARNILMADDFTCKVSDFGMSRDMGEGGEYYKSSNRSAVPVRWTAPEALELKRYSEKSDVWSFGILLHEVFTAATTPYSGMSNELVWMRVKAGYRLPRPEACPDDVYDGIMMKCWAERPEDRPTFAELVALLKGRVKGSHKKILRQSALQQSARTGPDSRDQLPSGDVNGKQPAGTPDDYLDMEGSDGHVIHAAEDIKAGYRHFSWSANAGKALNRAKGLRSSFAATVGLVSQNASLARLVVGGEVIVSGYPCMGTVAFIGHHHASGEPRVLVQLDKALGDNNGSVGGHVYCGRLPEDTGVLVAPSKVKPLITPGSGQEARPAGEVQEEDNGGAEKTNPALAGPVSETIFSFDTEQDYMEIQ